MSQRPLLSDKQFFTLCGISLLIATSVTKDTVLALVALAFFIQSIMHHEKEKRQQQQQDE